LLKSHPPLVNPNILCKYKRRIPFSKILYRILLYKTAQWRQIWYAKTFVDPVFNRTQRLIIWRNNFLGFSHLCCHFWLPNLKVSVLHKFHNFLTRPRINDLFSTFSRLSMRAFLNTKTNLLYASKTAVTMQRHFKIKVKIIK